MARILSIETSTALCSVALALDGRVCASRRSGITERAHASLTAVYCDEVLHEAGLKAEELDAVCISEGPGSYTGLRVGLSTAKGICFGAGIRLLSVCSPDILAEMGKAEAARIGASRIVPMIDARRMEVYTSVHTTDGKRQGAIEAKVIGEGAFEDIAAASIFIGDGALKCRDIIRKGTFIEAFPEASAMAGIAEEQFNAGNFRDVAYFEPFYLKDFVATTSKKSLF